MSKNDIYNSPRSTSEVSGTQFSPHLVPVQLGDADVSDHLGAGDVEVLQQGTVSAHLGHQLVRGDVGDHQLSQMRLCLQTVRKVSERLSRHPDVTEI